MDSLPRSEHLDTQALSRIFNNTTNSYKFLFLLSIMDILARRNFDVKTPVSFTDLTVEMLSIAWVPHTFFKLSFGKQDSITKKLDSLVKELGETAFAFTTKGKEKLRQSLASSSLGKDKELMRYVPFRLLIPFLEDELMDVNKSKGTILENAMPKIANDNFDRKKPLYKFNSDNYKDCESICINTEWSEYLQANFTIIYAWVSWNWLQFMQKRNPSTPNLSKKLFIPINRESHETQSDYWKQILNHEKGRHLTCIYSETALVTHEFSLDHYLPWSFVAHNQLWNLIPTTPSVNSSKSNILPDEKYFDAFVETQHAGIHIAKQIFSEHIFENRIECFISDLSLKETSDIFNLTTLRDAYKQTINPLNNLAANQGFSTGWQFNLTP